MARRQVSLKVLENGAQTFVVRHRWEDRPVPPPPDGAPVVAQALNTIASALSSANVARLRWLIPDSPPRVCRRAYSAVSSAPSLSAARPFEPSSSWRKYA